MIKERFMVTGERLDNGEPVTGDYTRNNAQNQQGGIIDREGRIHPVKLKSIEPVAVAPTANRIGGGMWVLICPNCEHAVAKQDGVYCKQCGQRLDWR